jgi:AcrR family transcriptional regulator
MADIGAAAGIVPSSIYHHFPGKTDLLVAAAGEAARRLRAAADQALTEAGRPRDALGLLLGAHVALTIEDRHLIGILAHETAQLPEDERTMLRRRQAGYLAIWVQVLGAVMPERERAELVTIIEATHSMIYLVVRACHDELRPGLRGQLTGIGMTLLLSG